MRRTAVLLAVAALVATGAAPGCNEESGAAPQSKTQRTNVALYSGRGCWDHSLTAGREMFAWMGLTTETVNAAYINANDLSAFDAVFIPGGDMSLYAIDINAAGKEHIRRFVSGGGAYIGICGGAYFAASAVYWRGSRLDMTPLGIFSGTASGPANDIVAYPAYGMCRIDIATHEHPVTAPEGDHFQTLYYWGPVLVPNLGATVTVLGRYSAVNQPAMIAFEYGAGRVFIIGAHPEIEEDDDRDATDFADELDDEGSEWDLMKRAVMWSLKR